MSSYFNERTAEYAVLPRLQQALTAEFGSALPIFYWKTREGNRQSQEIHCGARFRLVAVFARRPKTTGQPFRIAGKLNQALFEFAETAKQQGIVTIAAFPAVQSLFELSVVEAAMIWFLLLANRQGDFNFHVNLSPSMTYEGCDDGSVRVLSLPEIVQHIRETSQVLFWNQAIDVVTELGRLRHGHRKAFPFFGIGGYKPVYVLMEDRLFG